MITRPPVHRSAGPHTGPAEQDADGNGEEEARNAEVQGLPAALAEQLSSEHPSLVRCVGAGWSIMAVGADGTVSCPACRQRVPTVELDETDCPVICVHGRRGDSPAVAVPVGTKVRLVDSWLITYAHQPSIMHLLCGKTSPLIQPLTTMRVEEAQSGHVCGPVGSPWNAVRHPGRGYEASDFMVLRSMFGRLSRRGRIRRRLTAAMLSHVMKGSWPPSDRRAAP